MTEAPMRIFRKDYRPPDYLVDRIDLSFDIRDDKTRVTAVAAYRRNPAAGTDQQPLVLTGRELTLVELKLDGKALTAADYRTTPENLTIHRVPQAFELTTVTDIFPHQNTALEGLYASGPMLCTQCEAEGFRRITWYPDRPDVMARYSVT